MTRIAVLQMCSGIDPAENARVIVAAVGKARAGGAAMLFAPEMCGLLDRDRQRAAGNIVAEADNPVLIAARDAAAEHGIWLAIGSLAVRRSDGQWANRSFLIDDKGGITARYDKIHMFDVDLASGEKWRESTAYAAGDRVVTAASPVGAGGIERFDVALGLLHFHREEESQPAADDGDSAELPDFVPTE